MSEYLTPDQITGVSFETKRKGIDPEAVKRHLAATAQTVHELSAERDALAAEVEELRAELARAPAEVAPQAPLDLDEDELTERLGQDAARILAEARAAAADRITEAEAEAANITGAAEEIYAQRSAEADTEAQRIRATASGVVEETRAEAEQQAAQIVAAAEAQVEQTRLAATSERKSADADADRLIREAELTRRQILEDLARRRSAARRQIEQLRAGRERLLASHETVRRALDEIGEELAISMSEARAAAETAGHTVSDTTIEELEAEIETARLTGLLDTGPLPVVKKSVASEPVPEARVEPEPEPEPVPVVEVEGDIAAQHDDDDGDGDGDDGATGDDDGDDGVTGDDDGDHEATGDDEAAGEAEEDLTNVVQLDAARGEVDTASHPATGRGAASRTEAPSSPALPSKKVSEAKDAKRAQHPAGAGATVTELGASKSTSTSNDTDHTETNDTETNDTASSEGARSDGGEVDDLFASLRSETDKPAKKKPAKKKTKAKKSAKKKSAKNKPVPQVDSAELARRLKRVLADEQSKAMSTVKSGETVPSLDELLGGLDDHCDAYWAIASDEIPGDNKAGARSAIDDLVKTIRRRVGDGLEGAGDDKEAAVASLRSVYRQIKTGRVGEAADDAMLA